MARKDTQSRLGENKPSVEVGAALCVRSLKDSNSLPLTPAELAAQDELELAVAECKAELAGRPLHSEDERSSDNSECSVSPGPGARSYAYERAGGFTHDQSVHGEPGYGDPKRKPFSYPGDADHPHVPEREKLVPFVNIWPDLEFCDHETWREAVDLHNTKLANRRAKRDAVAAKAASNYPDALFALRRIKKLDPLAFGDTLAAHYDSVMRNPDLSRARSRRHADYEPHYKKVKRLAKRACYDQYARYRSDVHPAGVTLAKYARDDVYS
eukprot:6136735-Pleurochrysis_carterae.AAC.1